MMATKGAPRLVLVTQPASEFFKDEGGRANYLTVQVALHDCVGSLVSVPLRITLLFESGQVVDDQDIFRIMGSNSLVLQSDNPIATIHFRLEKVSRRNDGQRFKLKIDVDPTRSVIYGVAPVVTTPICVLSKRKSAEGAASTLATATAAADGCNSRKQPKLSDGAVSKQVAAMQAQLNRLMALVEAQHRLLSRLTLAHAPKDLDTLLTEEDSSFRTTMMDPSVNEQVTSFLNQATTMPMPYGAFCFTSNR